MRSCFLGIGISYSMDKGFRVSFEFLGNMEKEISMVRLFIIRNNL